MSGIPTSITIMRPPANAEQEARRYLETARHFVIDCPEMEAHAAEDLKRIKVQYKALEDQRFEITRPLDQAKKAVMEFFEQPLGYLRQAETILKRAIGNWHDEQARIAREAEAAARQRALEAQRKLEEQAAKLEARGKSEQAEEKRMQAALAPAIAAASVVAPPPKSSGISMRETWSAEVENLMELARAVADGRAPLNAIEPNMPMLNGTARAQKDAMNIPGVKAVCVKTVAARA